MFKQYISSNFLIDALSTIPIDYIILMIKESEFAKYFRLLRLLKIYRIVEIINLIRQHTTVNVPLLRIFLLFIFYFIISHWYNCIMIFVGKWELGMNRRFDGKTLL